MDTDAFFRFRRETERLNRFFNSLPAVRRALANVPTFMIFDDHEITDDWYLLRSWCDKVMGSLLGRRFVQNGLLAYAIFQAWGNTPEQFVASASGGTLLRAAVAWRGGAETDDKVHEATIAARLLPALDQRPIFDGTDRHRLRRGPHALNWHYRVEGPRHEVIVLDTRTWRGYPGRNLSPALLSPEAFDQQLPLGRATKKDLVVVVAPGPTALVPLIEMVKAGLSKPSERQAKDAEDWSLDEPAYQMLLARLGNQGAFVGTEVARVSNRSPESSSCPATFTTDTRCGCSTGQTNHTGEAVRSG